MEVFSLKGWNMTGWRTAAIVGNATPSPPTGSSRQTSTPACSSVQLATVAALDAGAPPEMREIYQRRRDLVCNALAEIGGGRHAAEGHDLRLGAGPGRPHVGVVLRDGARGVGGGRVAGLSYGTNGEGFQDLAHGAGRAPHGGRRAPAREPRGIGVHYCGVVPTQRDLMLQLALLEEVRDPEPPIRLSALFYEPGPAAEVAEELRGLGRRGRGRRARSEGLAAALGLPVFAGGGWSCAGGRLPGLPAVRDEPRHGLLRASGAGGCPPSGTRTEFSCASRSCGRPDHRRRWRPSAPAHRGDRRAGLRALRPLCGRARILAGRRRASGSSLPETFSSRGVMPPVERINLPGSSP